MKTIFVGLTLALAATGAVGAQKKEPKSESVAAQFDPVKSFQSLVQVASATQSWKRARQNPQTGKWVRHTLVAGDLRYDVKKTDSMVNPLIGIVSFKVVVAASPWNETEQEALDSTAPPFITTAYEIDISYHVANERWSMQEIKYKTIDRDSPLRGTVYTMNAEKLEKERDSTLSMALRPWAATP